ncbi:MAG: hypothetical protein GC204_02900 [Chloroflexi bacterium]|nr:hypothetical protein [Chloroflexota bacterium]
MMPIQAKHTLRTLHVRLRDVFRLGLTAFQRDVVPWWAAGSLIGLSTYQGLLEGWDADGSQTPGREELSLMTQEQEALAGIQIRSIVGHVAVSEMYERYQRASSQPWLLSKEARN